MLAWQASMIHSIPPCFKPYSKSSKAGMLPASKLTRVHVIPFSRGGRDTWMNVVTACRSCNERKSDRTPEMAHMELLYLPYVPNRAEYLILTNRRILADQMEFLAQHVPAQSRLHQPA